MRLSYEYSTKVTFSPAVGQHNFLLRCLPQVTPFQSIVTSRFSLPETFWRKESMDGFGNIVIAGGISERHSELSYSSRGIIEQSVYCIPDADPHPMYALPSRLSTPLLISPRGEIIIGNASNGFRVQAHSGSLPTGEGGERGSFLPLCLSIMHTVHELLDYAPGTTHVLTTSSQVLRQRSGVCQDFAHVMISLCRAMGMKARYVCGLMQGEGQTHAWVEVHDGQCWYAFDPTNDTAIATGYIKLAHGRDALDCPVSRGTYIGVTQETTEVFANLQIDEIAN